MFDTKKMQDALRRLGFASWYRPQAQSFKQQLANSITFMLGRNGPHIMRESTTLDKINDVYKCPCTWFQNEDKDGLLYFDLIAVDPKCMHHGAEASRE